jgi:hypothetical protein
VNCGTIIPHQCLPYLGKKAHSACLESALCPSVRAGPGLAGPGLPWPTGFVTADCEKACSACLPGTEGSAPGKKGPPKAPISPVLPRNGPRGCDIPFCDKARHLVALVPVCLGKRALPLGLCWSWSAWESELALPAREGGLCPSVCAGPGLGSAF